MSRNGVNRQFSQKQQKALTALLSGMSQAEAAKAANVSLRTVQRWIASPAFSQALSDSIGSAVSVSVSRLAALADVAVDVMSEVMTSKEATISQRLRASNFLLTSLLKLGEYADVTARIEALEDRLLNGPQSPQQGDS